MSDDLIPRPMQVRADAMRLQALGFESGDNTGGGANPPEIVDAPSVTLNGSVVTSCIVGDTLNCTLGNWNYEPTSYWQTWLAGSAVVGNGPSYVAKAGDAEQNISCSVTATNAAGNGNAMSNAVAVQAASGGN